MIFLNQHIHYILFSIEHVFFQMSMLFLKYQYAYFLFENKRFSMLFENEVSINVLFSYIYKFSVSILYFKYEI